MTYEIKRIRCADCNNNTFKVFDRDGNYTLVCTKCKGLVWIKLLQKITLLGVK